MKQNNEPDPDIRPETWLNGHDKLLGARIVLELLSRPGEPVHAVELMRKHARRAGIRKQKYPTTQSWGSPIPMFDYAARKDCVRELERYIRRIEAASNLGLEEEEARLKGEYASLLRYLRENTTPQGATRNFTTPSDKAYQSAAQAVLYLLRIAAREAPEVFRCLKQHLRTGLCFTWTICPELDSEQHQGPDREHDDFAI